MRTNGFMPSPGLVKQVTELTGSGIRIDSYISGGYGNSCLLRSDDLKLIVRATTREYAVSVCAPTKYKVTGIKTNISYLNAIMHTPDFVRGGYDTAFLEKNERIIHRHYGNLSRPERMTDWSKTWC